MKRHYASRSEKRKTEWRETEISHIAFLKICSFGMELRKEQRKEHATSVACSESTKQMAFKGSVV
jgi:hypothetical protein